MDKLREKYGRERDADVALLRADSAIAEAAQLTTCPELAKDIDKLREAIDDISLRIWDRKNGFFREIHKEGEKSEINLPETSTLHPKNS